MALAIDITNGHGLSNEECRQLLSKKSKVHNAVLHCKVSHVPSIQINNNDPPILGIIQQVKPYTWPTIQDQLEVH